MKIDNKILLSVVVALAVWSIAERAVFSRFLDKIFAR